MKVVILLPAYNVASRIGPLLDQLGSLPAILAGEWIRRVVDDGSTDDSGKVAARHGAVVITHEANRGKGAALATGFRWAVDQGYDAIVTMDADGQHEPSSVPALVAAAERDGADIVVGNRMDEVARMPPLRVWTNRTTSAMVSRLAGTPIADSQSGFRVIRTRVVRELVLESTRYDAESELLIKAGRRGFAITMAPIRSVYQGSESHINPVVDTFRFLRLVVRSLVSWRGTS
jgi:polyprenyl-phospho-N-acetylgalactosaminyl synthase